MLILRPSSNHLAAVLLCVGIHLVGISVVNAQEPAGSPGQPVVQTIGDMPSIAPQASTFDGDVDGADFLVWQRDMNVGDLADWQTNFGTPAAVSSAAAVPEPASASLLAIALGGVALVGRRKKQWP